MKPMMRSITACCLASATALAGNLAVAQLRVTDSGKTESAFVSGATHLGFDSGETEDGSDAGDMQSALESSEARSTFVWNVREISLNGLPRLWGPGLLAPHERILWAQWSDGAFTLGVQGAMTTSQPDSLRVIVLQAIRGGARGFESRLLLSQPGAQGLTQTLPSQPSLEPPHGWSLVSQSLHTDGPEPRHLALLMGPPTTLQQPQLPRSVVSWLRRSGWRALAGEHQAWASAAGHRLTLTRLGATGSTTVNPAATRYQRSLWLWSVRMQGPPQVNQSRSGRPS